MTLSGSVVSVTEGLSTTSSGATGPTGAYSVSKDSVLAYQAALWPRSQPVVVDRGGRELARPGVPGDIGDIAASPDGSAIAVSVIDTARSTRDLWLYPTAGGPARRLTFEAADDFAPVWSPDGSRLLFSSMRDGVIQLFTIDVKGAAAPQLLETDRKGLGRFAADWSRDEGAVLYIAGARAIRQSDLFIAPLADPRQARPLLDSSFVETHGRIAPGGRWFAYTSNESGQLEVYVDRFPALGDKHVISAGGWPRWSRDGRELFYLSQKDEVMVTSVRATASGIETSSPRALFRLNGRPTSRLDAYSYDVLPENRFIVNRLLEEPGTSMITIVLNWTAVPRGQP
jgi:Tol biopolymer transport system component